jgi:hypothetical protein
MLLDRLKGPVELSYYNPLHARVGAGVTIDLLPWRDLPFRLVAIHEYRRVIGGQQFPFVDYVLQARPLGKDPVVVRLRLNPVDDPEAAAGLTHHVLLLQQTEDMPYNEELHRVVQDSTRTLQIRQDDQVQAEYTRINDVTTPYQAEVTILTDKNQDQRVQSDEIETQRLVYWDYWREVADEAGQPQREFLFVEMNEDNGWMQMWQGSAIDPQRVMVI